MNDPLYDEVAAKLKEGRDAGMGVTELAILAQSELGSHFGALPFIATFKIAFGIPVEVLHRAHAWEGFNLGGSGISDTELEGLLKNWICRD
ncbi:hypothetical protein ACFW1M_04065 [Streptomyces inhibens]|uniref:hypothetical protein n=1 Tax=Streptomyces inhibens TaxID=2293571 RepID=UPI003681782F